MWINCGKRFTKSNEDRMHCCKKMITSHWRYEVNICCPTIFFIDQLNKKMTSCSIKYDWITVEEATEMFSYNWSADIRSDQPIYRLVEMMIRMVSWCGVWSDWLSYWSVEWASWTKIDCKPFNLVFTTVDSFLEFFQHRQQQQKQQQHFGTRRQSTVKYCNRAHRQLVDSFLEFCQHRSSHALDLRSWWS